MRNNFLLTVLAGVLIFSNAFASEKIGDDFAQIELSFKYEPVAPKSGNLLQINFNLAQDWHFYADEKTAPQGTNLKIIAQGQGFLFSSPIMPPANLYFDKITNSKLKVYSGKFSVFVPFVIDANAQSSEVKVTIDGLACSQQLCRKASYELSKKLEISASAPIFSTPVRVIVEEVNPVLWTSAAIALPLAIVAGLLLNIMPCVWPILPIIVMRLISQAKQSKAKSIAHGFAFALGIILFFVALAAVNIILKLSFDIVFQWGDQFRNSAFVIAMAMLMVVLALYMFGLFSIGLPVSVSGQSNGRGGLAGSVATGFLAAVLSTPCSFAILTFVLAWAQTQPIPLATITILLIGVGMAAPYVILTAMPALLAKIPKPGRWMELFKHITGFILLGIGVKLLEAVPAGKIINVLYYAIILAVCVWMWGVWVQYNTPKAKKLAIRLAAIVLAVVFGFIFLSEPRKGLINWQEYDAQVISAAQKNNQPVLIDFTADWCMSCKILDKTVYSNAKIAELIKRKNVLAIKADTTEFDYPAARALKEIYKEPAVPVTILLLPNQADSIHLPGNLIKSKLTKHLNGLEDKN
ncbi:MAG: cytochrome c biogenesis protein CcdA [Phycisphaerae bacterium]|jgi:thiol:disulfide interchange protein